MDEFYWTNIPGTTLYSTYVAKGKGPTGSGRAVEDDAFRRLDAHLLVELGVRERELHCLLQRAHTAT